MNGFFIDLNRLDVWIPWAQALTAVLHATKVSSRVKSPGLSELWDGKKRSKSVVIMNLYILNIILGHLMLRFCNAENFHGSSKHKRFYLGHVHRITTAVKPMTTCVKSMTMLHDTSSL